MAMQIKRPFMIQMHSLEQNTSIFICFYYILYFLINNANIVVDKQLERGVYLEEQRI